MPHDPDQIDILHHLIDGPAELFGLALPMLARFGVTKHVVMMWVASLILIIVLGLAARQKGVVPRGLRNFFEPLILFVRNAVLVPNMGEAGLPYLPFLLTLFCFILTCNLLGLVPNGATATGNISVTATLAIISAVVTHFAGVRQNGGLHYLKAIVPPVPLWLWPLMLVVEIIGLLAKPFALAVRLWANMNAGHIVLLVIMGFIFLFKNWGVVGISLFGGVAISLLEMFVALVQAYVFTYLTAVFMGLALHPEH
ncbi:MAG: F0F1 ATP synthase subunit A [Candidatus Latescibacterota bacterium]|nr:MAG: F0F1 ATP synthase subunit A [Candidatus Latescibacterota bacterium]